MTEILLRTSAFHFDDASEAGESNMRPFNTSCKCHQNSFSEVSLGKASSLSSHVFSVNTAALFMEHFGVLTNIAFSMRGFGQGCRA